jgi:regulator of replication initiation timing
MEALALLEKKIEDLVSLISLLRGENASLARENEELKRRSDDLEVLALEKNKQSDEERQFTKSLVDSLIKDIDAVVEQER